MNSKWRLVVLVLVFVLMEEVVAPRGRAKSTGSLGSDQTKSQPPRSKSLSPLKYNRWLDDEMKGPAIEQRSRTSQFWASGFDDWMSGKMKATIIDEVPETSTRASSRQAERRSDSQPSSWKPHPSVKKQAHAYLSQIDVQARMTRINFVISHDQCMEQGNKKEGNSRCKEMVSTLNSLPSDTRTEACQRITDGKCRKTGTDQRGNDIYQCTCHPYEKRTSFRIISRSNVERSKVLLLKDCVNPDY